MSFSVSYMNRRRELERVFGEFGTIYDVHIPRDYYTQYE